MNSTTLRAYQRGRAIASAVGVCALVIGTCPWVGIARANPWAAIANPILPLPGTDVPSIKQVPGKDFSDIRDRDDAAVFDPQQVVAWDGSGGVRNSFDYTGTQPAPLNQQNDLVDGISAGGDALFHSLRADTSSMLMSVEGDPNILYVRPSALPGFGTWATAADIDTMNWPIDTDGLEIWGGDNNDDSDRYSLTGDPAIPGLGRIAIWSFTPALGPSAPHTTVSDLAAALDRQFAGIGVGGPYWSQLVELMDVDAIMTFGTQVTFSIRPVSFEIPTAGGPPTLVSFDGGEIWEYDGALMPTKYLKQGGYDWNTALDIRGTFGVVSENIDALEAVSAPEPSSFLLVLLGMMVAGGVARRR